jgi:hypothetical protein
VEAVSKGACPCKESVDYPKRGGESWQKQKAQYLKAETAASFISRFEEPEVAVTTLMDAVKLMDAMEIHARDLLDAKNWTLRYLGDAAFKLREKAQKRRSSDYAAKVSPCPALHEHVL